MLLGINGLVAKRFYIIDQGLIYFFGFDVLYAYNIQRITEKLLFNQTVNIAIVLKFATNTFIVLVIGRIGNRQGNPEGHRIVAGIQFFIQLIVGLLSVLKLQAQENAVESQHIEEE